MADESKSELTPMSENPLVKRLKGTLVHRAATSREVALANVTRITTLESADKQLAVAELAKANITEWEGGRQLDLDQVHVLQSGDWSTIAEKGEIEFVLRGVSVHKCREPREIEVLVRELVKLAHGENTQIVVEVKDSPSSGLSMRRYRILGKEVVAFMRVGPGDETRRIIDWIRQLESLLAQVKWYQKSPNLLESNPSNPETATDGREQQGGSPRLP